MEHPDNPSGAPLVAEAVLAAIKALPARERERLFEALAKGPDLSAEYKVFPRSLFDATINYYRFQCELVTSMNRRMVPVVSEAWRRGECARKKRRDDVAAVAQQLIDGTHPRFPGPHSYREAACLLKIIDPALVDAEGKPYTRAALKSLLNRRRS
jgi:hypothetical protein